MLTIPRSLFKSYTKDLSFPIFEIDFSLAYSHILLLNKGRDNIMTLDVSENTSIFIHYKIWESCIIDTFQHGFWLRGVQP